MCVRFNGSKWLSIHHKFENQSVFAPIGPNVERVAQKLGGRELEHQTLFTIVTFGVSLNPFRYLWLIIFVSFVIIRWQNQPSKWYLHFSTATLGTYDGFCLCRSFFRVAICVCKLISVFDPIKSYLACSSYKIRVHTVVCHATTLAHMLERTLTSNRRTITITENLPFSDILLSVFDYCCVL